MYMRWGQMSFDWPHLKGALAAHAVEKRSEKKGAPMSSLCNPLMRSFDRGSCDLISRLFERLGFRYTHRRHKLGIL